MINGDLTELIRQFKEAKRQFTELDASFPRLTEDLFFYSKTLAADVNAIRSPGIPEDYKLEALERIARRYFSFKRVYYGARREIIREEITQRITRFYPDYMIELNRDWLQTWLQVVYPFIFIAINSDEISNTPVNKVFDKTRNLIREYVEIELIGRTIDTGKVKTGKNREIRVFYLSSLPDEDDRGRLYEGNYKHSQPLNSLIDLDKDQYLSGGYVMKGDGPIYQGAGGDSQITNRPETTTPNAWKAVKENHKHPKKMYYTGQGLEDEIIEIMAVRDIIDAVGASDIYYYLTEDPPEKRPLELQPTKDQWPLINAKNHYIKKRIRAASKRMGYYEG